MPFCRDCGFEVQKDWVACPKCGAAQSSPLEGRVALKEAEVKVVEEKVKPKKTIPDFISSGIQKIKTPKGKRLRIEINHIRRPVNKSAISVQELKDYLISRTEKYQPSNLFESLSVPPDYFSNMKLWKNEKLIILFGHITTIFGKEMESATRLQYNIEQNLDSNGEFISCKLVIEYWKPIPKPFVGWKKTMFRQQKKESFGPKQTALLGLERRFIGWNQGYTEEILDQESMYFNVKKGRWLRKAEPKKAVPHYSQPVAGNWPTQNQHSSARVRESAADIAERNMRNIEVYHGSSQNHSYTYTCKSPFCGFSETYNRIHPGKKCSRCGKPMNRN